MTDGEAVIASYFFHKRFHQVGGNYEVDTGHDCCQHYQRNTFKTGINAGGGEYIREPIQHVASQEDALPLGEACY